MAPPPVDRPPARSARSTSSCVMRRATRSSGRSMTSIWRVCPPQALTSTTPGTVRRAYAISQSRRVRTSLAVCPGQRTVKCRTSPSPVVIGPISGIPTPRTPSRASGRRCVTSARASAMGRSSSKMTVTADTPAREMLRCWTVLGIPASASSTGRVTSASTSSGERPGAAVSTCTCTLVMSGTASTGRLRHARPQEREEHHREEDHPAVPNAGRDDGRITAPQLGAHQLALEETAPSTTTCSPPTDRRGPPAGRRSTSQVRRGEPRTCSPRPSSRRRSSPP